MVPPGGSAPLIALGVLPLTGLEALTGLEIFNDLRDCVSPPFLSIPSTLLVTELGGGLRLLTHPRPAVTP